MVDDFLKAYKSNIGGYPTVEQNLLMEYFTAFKEELPLDAGSPDTFVKAFRTRAICTQGWQDLVVWAIMGGGGCNQILKTLEDYYGS